MASRRTILVLGPPPTAMGGMASVVEQILGLDLQKRYRAELFAATSSAQDDENRASRVLRHLRHLVRLHRKIKQTDASVVHIHTCSGFSFFRSVLDMLIAKMLARPAVLHIHGATFDTFHASAGAITKWMIRWSLAQADRVVALSKGWHQKLSAMSPNAQVVIVENAVELPPNPPPRRCNGPCRFVLLARMDEWKGIDDLLNACEILRDSGVAFEVHLAGPAGTAGDSQTLPTNIESRGLDRHVRYLGPLRGDAKTDLLRHADAYVQPSHNEGMPIALLEALSFGLAIVATDVGAVGEVITNQREGLLVASHRPNALAAAMRALIEEPSFRVAAGIAARRLAESRFSLSRLDDDLCRLYDDTLAGGSLNSHAFTNSSGGVVRPISRAAV